MRCQRLTCLDLDIKLTGDYEPKNFIPKKLIHTYSFHTKSITQIRFIPDSGHLLLSAAADSKIALWDVYHQRELLRTYSGHTKSVNDIDFNASGTQFVSASYDRFMKLWDTETGQCLNKFTTGKTPHVVRINPAIPHEFLAGMSDKKILQYDTRSGEMVQEYDHHLGPVNTITFCDEVSGPCGCCYANRYANSCRIAVLSPRPMTNLFEHGNMGFPSRLNLLPSHTCSPWSVHLPIRLGNTLLSSRPTTKSPFTLLPTASAKIARRATEDIMSPDMHLMFPLALMANLLAQATAAVMCAFGIGRHVKCGIRSKPAMRQFWLYSGIRARARSLLLVI